MTNNIAHLQPKVWSFVNRQLIKKAISEFSHELILTTEFILEETDGCIYLITSDNNEFTYQFKAKKYVLDHWLVDEKTQGL